MRITTQMISNRYLTDATRNLNSLQTINRQLTTGKEISRPSDNPYKVARSMQLNTDLNTNVQYKTNIKDAINWLDTTDESLNQASSCITRIRTLMVASGNVGYGTDERKAIADEINERVAELGQILNGNFNGKYIFGGTKTASTPVSVQTDSATGNKYIVYADKDSNPIFDENGNLISTTTPEMANNYLKNMDSALSTEISQGVIMDYNVTVADIMNYQTDTVDANGHKYNVMSLLSDITNNLVSADAADREKVIGENLDEIDKVLSNILSLRAEVGAKQNRMESAESKNKDDSFNMTDILSRNEDIDFTEKTIQYATAQTIYQACLQVSAQILPKSLLDYL